MPPLGTPGAGGNSQMQGLSEKEQSMVKMVSSLLFLFLTRARCVLGMQLLLTGITCLDEWYKRVLSPKGCDVRCWWLCPWRWLRVVYGCCMFYFFSCVIRILIFAGIDGIRYSSYNHRPRN